MNKKKCAILTMDKLDDFVDYDKMLDEPLAECGWLADHVSWRQKDVNWSIYDAVIIRSTWDYQDNPEEFMQVLNDIQNTGVTLLNSLKIAQWNIDKSYLKEVETMGAPIVPSLWIETFDFDKIEGYFEHFGTHQIVIKPTISANSDNTFWLKKNTYIKDKPLLDNSLKNKNLMVQPFIPAVIEMGEYSIFYFAGEFSHAILKTPKKGDFRVQEEHGGLLTRIEPSKALLKSAQKALKCIPEPVLYARIDLVEFENEYKLMEIELIEPSLYFNLDEKSAKRFALAFDSWMQ